MNPSKVRRDRLNCLTDLPIDRRSTIPYRCRIVPAPDSVLEKRRTVFVRNNAPRRSGGLLGRDPYTMSDEAGASTNELTSCVQQPVGIRCVLDVFISITRFMSGSDPKPWWEFTMNRNAKRALNRNESIQSAT